MKHNGCILEFTEERNGELMRVYRELINECRYVSIPELSRRIVSTPCSRFWVSEERATVVCAALMRGDKSVLKGMRRTKREMYEEIYRRVLIEKMVNPQAKVAQLVSRIVYSPAPCFYMQARSAMEAIYRIKRNKKN